jgi:muconolactone D-isomerase
MKFLVQIRVSLPATMPEDERAALLAAELERGRELRDAGAIVSIWRVPGGPLRNAGIWETDDATELHALISSLPLFPYLETEITPLARHPIFGDQDE